MTIYISSDTNIWLDFSLINQIHLPFRLPYTFLMSQDAMEDELLNPPGIYEKVKILGLQGTQLTEEEFYLAEAYTRRYIKLSVYDCYALAIARQRNIILLTGDKALRTAASAESVQILGTLGILDQLLDKHLIDQSEYQTCIKSLTDLNGGKIRLPSEELEKRLKNSR